MSSAATVHPVRIGKGLGDLSDATLRFYRQIGIEGVVIPTHYSTQRAARPLVPPTQIGPHPALGPAWDEEEIRRITTRVMAFGLAPDAANLQLSGRIVMGQPGRDQDIERVRANLRILGRLRIPVAAYNFTALRASEGYRARPGGGRGDSDLRDFDHARVRDLAPLEGVGCHSAKEMWDRLHYFLRAVLPVAEEAGVRLAAHPNDPPIPVFRGVAQPLADLGGLRRLLELVPSPSNCIFFDTGVLTEMGEDPVAAIHEFGDHGIALVHFRNVRVEEPRYRYVETFVDDGECDMMACMQALQDMGYRGIVDPDHTPSITDDTPDTWAGWAFAVGHMIALRNEAQRRAMTGYRR